MILRNTLMVCAIMLAPMTAQAQKAIEPRITAETLIEALTPPPRLRLRGLTIAAIDEPAPSVDLSVEFAYNSADLTPAARALLVELAGALNSDALTPFRFMLAGHTDAVGSEAYNADLSLRRAQSVAEYLAVEHGVAPSRLDIEGFGETRLLFPDQPEHGRNRRVEIRTLE